MVRSKWKNSGTSNVYTGQTRLLCVKGYSNPTKAQSPSKARGRESPILGTVALSEHSFVFLLFLCILSTIPQNVQKFLTVQTVREIQKGAYTCVRCPVTLPSQLSSARTSTFNIIQRSTPVRKLVRPSESLLLSIHCFGSNHHRQLHDVCCAVHSVLTTMWSNKYSQSRC